MNETKRRYLNTVIKGAVDTENRIITGVVGSTGSVDRHGETLNPEGWVLDNFMKNPVILFGHDYWSLPVGKALAVYMKGKKLMFDIQFAATEKANEVFSLMKDKFLNAVSVGFIPLEYGENGGKYTYEKMELLELSVVPVPANPEALTELKSLAPKIYEKMETKNEEGKTLFDITKDLLSEITKEEVKPEEAETPVEEKAEPSIEENKEEEVVEKSGRVLSAKNESALREAAEKINAVLSALDTEKAITDYKEEETPDAEIKPITEENPTPLPSKEEDTGTKSDTPIAGESGGEVAEIKPVMPVIETNEDLVKTLKSMQKYIKKVDKNSGLALGIFKQLLALTTNNSVSGTKGGGNSRED